jgi:hypothetical protein
MSDVQRLMDIEAIKQLKARYLRYGDTRNWAEWRKLFTEDYEVEVMGVPRASPNLPNSASLKGLDNIIAAWSSMLDSIVTAHQAILPEITFIDPDNASGIWALHEIIWMPTCRFEGWGHYHEDYVSTKDGWRIRKTKTTRLKVQEDWL